MESKIAIYNTHEEAINAVKILDNNNFPMKEVSLLGKAEVIDNHIHIKPSNNVATAPVLLGIGAGTTLGILAGIGTFAIPGFGFLYGAGAVVGAIGGFDLGIISGGLVTLLTILGFKDDKVVKIHEHLKTGKFVVVIKGDLTEITKAEHILHQDGSHTELF